MSGNKMKKRWISLYVENQVGVLSKDLRAVFGKILQSGQSDCWNNGRSDCVTNDDRDRQRR